MRIFSAFQRVDTLFWIGLLIYGQLDGYLYETKGELKEQPFVNLGQLGKGIPFYSNNGDRLTLDTDLLNTAIFDKIRNSLQAIAKDNEKVVSQ